MRKYAFASLYAFLLGISSVVFGMDAVLKDNTSNSSFTVKEETNNSTIAIFRGDGNVGIGTTAPGVRLHVADGGFYAGHGTNHSTIRLGDITKYDGVNDPTVIITMRSGDKSALTVSGGGIAGIVNLLNSGGTNVLRVTDGGNVGVGTTNPSSKLEVSGGDIRVTSGSFIDDGTTLNVPDYVFNANYILKPLDQVKTYILEHKHLEGIPDMNDKKGWATMSMQDRDMKLLEKIEELTLYIIQLKEENESIKTENVQIKEELARIRMATSIKIAGK